MGLQTQPGPPAPEALVEGRSDNPDPNDIATQKYGDDASKIKQGYNEQFHETQRIMQELQLQRQQTQLLMERLGPSQPLSKSPADELAELGLPTGAIEKLIASQVEQRLAPLARMAQAQTEIMADIPDFPTVAPKLQAFLAINPRLQQEYNELSQVSPRAATKYIYREYQAQAPQPRISAADSGLNRVNASIPTTNSQGARMAAERDYQTELSQAKLYFEQSGDERPYWKIWHEMNLGGNTIHPAFGPSG
jgi:hypothetical protein